MTAEIVSRNYLVAHFCFDTESGAAVLAVDFECWCIGLERIDGGSVKGTIRAARALINQKRKKV
jgi:hypothetical protein